jgi:hypothetical protein
LGLIEATREQACEGKGLERLLGIERLEQLVSVRVAMPRTAPMNKSRKPA